MKKTIQLILISLFCQLSFGQQLVNSFPIGTFVYDLQNDHYLSAKHTNGRTFLNEFDNTHQIVWTDSVDFLVGDNLGHLESIQKFSNSNKIVLMHRKELTNNGLFDYDSSFFQLTLIDFNNHSMITYQDSAFADGWMIIPINETSSYFFYNSYKQYYPLQSKSYLLSSNLDTTFIAEKDSIQSHYFNSQYFSSYNSLLYQYDFLPDSSFPDELYLAKHSQDMSLEREYSVSPFPGWYTAGYVLPNEYHWHWPVLRQELTGDSLNYVFEGQSPGIASRKWYSIIFDHDLNELNLSSITTPTVVDQTFSTVYFQAQLNGSAFTDNMIQILAYAGNLNGNDVYHSLFSYDLELNLLCETTIALSPKLLFNNRLQVINNEPFLLREYNGQTELYEINPCQELGISSLNSPVNKELVKIIDITGREVNYQVNILQFYIYSDGSIEKKIIIDL